ncbi:protein stum [Vanessa cardui]|uniref:protein stum n=1 Tax=Vanessa cardui TaxID=171605 RepID=UPI001F1367CB|nr:protein stum [Vanessa cardui]
MALKLKYTDENGVLHIDMSPTASPVDKQISDPKFDTINKRFGQYDIFGGKYEDGGESQSLFRSRYNSFEEELANTPYAFATERSLRLDDPVLDITIDSRYDISPSKDIEDDRFFERDDLFGPKIDLKKQDTAFTVTQLIHAQDRYFDLSSRTKYESGISKGTVRSIADSFEVKSAPSSAKRTVSVKTESGEAFKVLSADSVKGRTASKSPVVSTSKRKGETSFAIIAEPSSRPTSPKSLPVEIRPGRVSPFKGRGFREETSRHNTPKTSAANSRSNSPSRRRTNSLSRIDKMATTATLLPPPPAHRPPRDFLKENMEEIRELSELNREKNEAEAEKKKRDEEIALLKEMGILDKKGEVKSVVNSRSNSRSNSPPKINMRSRSNSPSAILHYENIPRGSSEYLNKDDGAPKPVTHRSRLRSISKSQPQSNNGSPKNSKIPKRQNSVSPSRSNSRQSLDRNLNRNQRYMSNSTSSIHETIRIGSQVHDKRTSQSTQHLSISPSNIKGKPPISPGKSGPPPSNKSINPKRLSPIVGTPSKSPVEDTKPGSAKAPTKPNPAARKTTKTAGATPATSRFNSRQPSSTTSRDPSPDKRKGPVKSVTKPSNGTAKPISRTTSTRTTQKPPVSNKVEPKKPVSRTNSVKNLSRVPSSKALNDKPPLSRQASKKDLSEKSKSTSKINETGTKKSNVEKKISKKTDDIKNVEIVKKQKKVEDSTTDANVGKEIVKHDNGTQYDKLTNEKGELVILTKKNIVSMTTAAITSQPLEVVATVTNQLPATFEKAREKGIFDSLNSKDSLLDKEDEKETEDKTDKEEKKPVKSKTNQERTIFTEDHVKLRPLQPPYNNPQVERVKQKIDSILKEPEISTENILAAAKAKEAKEVAEKAKSAAKDVKNKASDKLSEAQDNIKKSEEMSSEIRTEAAKIVDSIMTPVEEPKDIVEKSKDIKKTIEPIVTVVNEKKNEVKTETVEKINETLVQGGPELEVLSSNLSTPGAENMTLHSNAARGSASDKSHSNGGYGGKAELLRFPQSTSTTPKPPPRAHREQKDKSPQSDEINDQVPPAKPNICSRLMGKCKAKCCPCCAKPQDEEETEMEEQLEPVEKKKFWKNMNCCKKKVSEEDVEIAAGKGTTIEFEHETKRKRKLRDILCACCRRRRVGDVEPPQRAEPSPPVTSSDVVQETGCCGKKKEIERRDSILSDQPPSICCNNRLGQWIRGACRKQSEQSSSRRTSLFSKNKSLSPTLPPEDTRKKLDPSLIEHTSVMRGAIPVLPAVLAYFCLLCNICVPGLGTIFSGMFCLCFGIPRFGVHDGAKHRIGSFVINLLVGCGQLFTVLFCLVGWGWSVWWGVIMVKTSRKYRKLKAEAEQEAEAPPVSDNNHRA